MLSADRFPDGTMSLVVDDERLEERLSATLLAAGLLRSARAGILAIEIDPKARDLAATLLDEALSGDEQDRVFLLSEAPDPWRLRSLRTVLARGRESWFGELLAHGRLDAELQPIVDLETRLPYAFEALIRPKRADGSSVSPLDALRAARETNRLADFDELARAACLRAGADRLAPGERLFLNIDPDSVPGGARDFESTLSLAGALRLDPRQVVFELIESESLADSRHLHSLLDRLRGEGYGVALDDLTSGFSTLTVLDRLRPDVAKLDGRLVRGAFADRYRSRLVKAFVDLARDLSLPLVVEGVETRDDFRFVTDLGVRLGQGYYFARPATNPAREFPILGESFPSLRIDA
jgi:EAL domain-containing protein (putative c-di-GMP-specific phosphodiesterase class I)